MLRVLLLTAISCYLMLNCNGQEIVNITVKPQVLLPENGIHNKVSVLFNHIDVADQINCWVKCDDKNMEKIVLRPDYWNKLSCIYYVGKEVSTAKNCLMDMNLTSGYLDLSVELIVERPITFFIGESVSVDRRPLFVDVGDDAIVTVIDGKYPDPVICDFVKQDGHQDGRYKQTDCEMSIHDVGFADAGLYNFTICLPGSSEDGCVKGQKEVIVKTKAQLVNITVKPQILLPEKGTQNKVSVLFNHIDVPDLINCWIKCDDENEQKIALNLDYGNKLSCIYYVSKDVRAAKNCLMDMNLTSSYPANSLDLIVERAITFFIGKSVSVDRRSLFVDFGDDAIVTVIDGNYPDPVICHFIKQDGSQDGRYKQTNCEMSIHDVGFADAGLYNFTICLPGSSEDGCVKGQKEVIVWQFSYDKMSNSVMVNITSADGGIDVRCVTGCSNIAERVKTADDGATSYVWWNVTTTPHIEGSSNGTIFLNSSSESDFAEHNIPVPLSDTDSSLIVKILVPILLVAAAVIIVIVCVILKRKNMPPWQLCNKGNTETRPVLDETIPMNPIKEEKNGHPDMRNEDV